MVNLEKRKRVMQRSIRLGHCICNPRQACPCDEFKEFNVCHCAGERREVEAGPVRLTTLIENPGCASKIDQASLKSVLATLPVVDHPDVIIGMPAGDDAGVFRLSPTQALVQTVDVFCPSVDDPYTFGRIAAANSLSDVYAMGGTPLTALSIVGYPIHQAPPSAMAEILRGGIDKMTEAGVAVIGGHSINDPEIKAGFAVTGIIDPDKIYTNAGALPGDALVLTKPLGVGIIAFAAQIGMADEASLAAIAESMTALNKTASELVGEFEGHAVTDVTGFGLMGHLSEMAGRSGVDVEIIFDDLPLFPGVLDCVAKGVLPGAIERNRESCETKATGGDGVSRVMLDICFDAQTSGGLLVALPEKNAAAFVRRLHECGVPHAGIIGTVTGKGAGNVKIEHNRTETNMQIVKNSDVKIPESSQIVQEKSCCGGTENAEFPCSAPAEIEPCCCGDSAAGTSAETTEQAFKTFMSRAGTPGALDVATKQAVNIALSVLTRCGPCIQLHMKKAREMGFTQEEIDEAAWMAVSFGGSPVMMFYNEFRSG